MKKITLALLSAVIFSAIASFGQTTQTFNFTGQMQTFVVPQGVTSIKVDLSGASGGNAETAVGGQGGRVECIVPVTPGETLQIYVGGAGKNGDNKSGRIMGGFNGGGTGYDDEHSWGGSGGGGASDIRVAPYNFSKRIVVGGGGGGGGIDGCSSSYMLNGGDGGGLTADDGQTAKGGGCDGSGFGASQTKPGKRGTYTLNPCENRSTDGDFGMGGHGYGWCDNTDQGGSGGGGGWFGGGSGNFGAGGGGSSYTISAAKKVEHTKGYQTGDGYVTLTYSPVNCSVPTKPLLISGKEQITSGMTSTYSVTEIKGVASYIWTVPTDAIINSGSGTNSINVTFGKESGFISVVAVNDCGQSEAQTLNVSVQEIIVPLVLTATVSASNSIICSGKNSTLTANISGGTAPYICNWMPGNLKGNSVSVSPKATTTYFLTVKDADGNIFTETITITVNTLLIKATSTKDTICNGGMTQLNATGGVKYHWYPETGLSCVDCANPEASPTVTTEYMVTVTNESGCTAQAKVKVVVQTCTGVKEILVTSITVYPIPFKDEFFISGLVSPENEITLMNSMGEIVMTKTVGPGNCKLETGKIASGVYFVIVKTKSGTVKKKVIKE